MVIGVRVVHEPLSLGALLVLARKLHRDDTVQHEVGDEPPNTASCRTNLRQTAFTR